MKDNIFLAFSNKKLIVNIAKMLISDGYKITSVAKNVSEINNFYHYYRGGIIIMGCTFDSVHINNLINDIPESFTVILIGNKEQLDICYDDRIFKLAVPLHKVDLICAVEMFTTIESPYKPSANKNSEDEKIIERAKHTLIDTYSMTEEQAHRYIQKKSMDTGKKLVEIARIILEV